MSLVSLIRDHVDIALAATSSKQLDGYTLSSLAYSIFSFSFTVIKQTLIYCLTFHWLRDFSYFCLTPSTLLSSFGNFNGVEYQPLSNLLAFSDSSISTGIGVVLVGFLNGCFSSMHISAANLVTIRRMLVQGVPAGLCSAFGTAIGQVSFLACVLFGFRGFLLPWLAFEPVNFLLGTGILLSVASATAQDRRTPTIQWSAKSTLVMYIFTNVALAWCEQSALFQWMGNISVGIEPTFLESTPFSENLTTIFGNVQQLAQTISFLLAFILGNLVGASFFGYLLRRFLEFLLRSRGIAIYYGLVKQANLPLATFIFAFGFGSLPYYGFDYLLAKGFGFVPNEHFFQQTLFSPTNLVSKTSQMKESSQGRLEDQLALLFTLEGERSKSFAVDTTPFDNGQYLKASQKRPQAFEDLNYRGEHLWTNRLSRISNIREQANQTQSSFLAPVFSWMRSFLWGDGPTANTHVYSEKGAGLRSQTPEKKRENWGDTRVDMEEHGTPSNDTNQISSPTGISRGNTQDANDSSPSYASSIANMKQKKELSPEREQSDNYIKEFDRQFDKGFSNFFHADPQALLEVEDQWQEKRIKEKCYTNPIYTFLLNTEIDAFLTRQPNSQWLSPHEEALLFKRRHLLSNYYDTLALTSQISTSKALSQLVPRSYANGIYNHQFKGTLKVARRLFSVKKAQDNFAGSEGSMIENEAVSHSYERKNELEKKTLPREASIETKHGPQNRSAQKISSELDKTEKTRVVKFDQPLFSSGKRNTHRILFHEELTAEPSVNLQQYEQSGTVPSKSYDTFMTAESKKPTIFLLEQAEPLPLYVSWDEQLRKLIITNRFQSRQVAGYTFSDSFQAFPTNSGNPYSRDVEGNPKQSNSHENTSWPNTMHPSTDSTMFTTWPIPNPLFHTSSSVQSLPASQAKVSSILDNETDTHFTRDKKVTKDNVTTTNKTQENIQGNIDTENTILETRVNSKPSQNDASAKSTTSLQDFLASLHQSSKNQFLFQTHSLKEPITNDMVNALLQWQKLIKEKKQLSKEDKQAAKEKISYWPENVTAATWSNELMDNDMEFDEPTENVLKKQTLLWEFIPPNHGGFFWPGKS